MNQSLINEISVFTSAFSEAMLHSLWQGLLLVVVLSISLKMMERSSARNRYLAATSTMFVQLLLFAGTFTWLYQQELQALNTESADISMLYNMVQNGQSPAQETSWFSPSMLVFNTMLGFVHQYHYAISLCWLVGAMLLSMRFASGLLYINKLKKELTPAPEKWQSRMREIAGKMGLKKKINFVVTNNIEVPTLIGWVKPIVLMPLSVLSQMPLSEVDSIIAHELAHVKRHDYLVNLMQSVIEILLFFNPAVWWMSSWINDERENSCDDLAISVIENHKVYIQALASLTGLVSAGHAANVPHNALAATGKKGSVLFRIKRIMKQVNKSHEHANPKGNPYVASHYFTRELTGKFLASFLILSAGFFMVVSSGKAQENQELKEVTSSVHFSLNDTTKKKVKVLQMTGDTLKLNGKDNAKFEFILSGDSSAVNIQELSFSQTDSLHKSGKYRVDVWNTESDEEVIMLDSTTHFFVEKNQVGSNGDTLKLHVKKIAEKTLSKMDTTGGVFRVRSSTNNSDTTKVAIRIRSDKTSSTSNVKVVGLKDEPIYIVDGIVVPSLRIKEITPSNIEKIDVLKGQTAIDKYGEKGKNGVVKITLKKGMELETLVEEEEIEVPIDEKMTLRYFLNDEEVTAEKIHNLSPKVIDRIDVKKGNKTKQVGKIQLTGDVVMVYTKPGVEIVEVQEGEKKFSEIEIVEQPIEIIEVPEVSEVEEVEKIESIIPPPPPKVNSEVEKMESIIPPPPPKVSSFVESFNIYPNPSDEIFNINFSLKTAGMVKVSVSDMAGKKVATVVEKQMSAGTQSLKWKANGMAEGMYIINIERDGEVLQQKVMLDK